MVYNYIKMAWRTLTRQKGYSFLNIAGLSIGLATSLLILLWVTDELRYDGFHKKLDRLYIVMHHLNFTNGQIRTGPDTQGLLGPALKETLPEVADATRVSFSNEMLLTVGKKFFKEQGHFADPNFFTLFTFPVVAGNLTIALQDNSSIAISESLAKKCFGQVKNAIGQHIRVNNQNSFTVSAVFQDVPKKSSLQFSFVLPFEVLFRENKWLHDWGASSIQTFVLLKENTAAQVVNSKIKYFVKKQFKESISTLMLQPFGEFYLYNTFENGKQTGGRVVYVQLFSVIAAFILVIACINFMNLATARSAHRAKEVGVRKVIGAGRKVLIGQFMTESFLLAGISMVLALLIVSYSLPFFNQLTEKHIQIPFGSFKFIGALSGLTVLASLLAGGYPAFFLSAIHSIKALKGGVIAGTSPAYLRQGLVVFQFVLSISLIMATVVVYRQIQYIKNKDLGLNQENLIQFAGSDGILEHYQAYKTELLGQPGIAQVALSNQNLMGSINTSQGLDWDGKNPTEVVSFQIINADHDFLQTVGARLQTGRYFSTRLATDSLHYIINETAARQMEMLQPLGQRLTCQGRTGRIIGVVKDFHITNLHERIMPVVVTLRPKDAGRVFVRIQPGQVQQAIVSLQNLHARFAPGSPFEYHFLDQGFEQMYRHDLLVSKLASCFAFICIFISCLGLFGLVTFTAQQRTKEIGIRKVLGASVTSIVATLSKNFLKPVLLANLLAWPLAGWAMHYWLESFVYRISLNWWMFAVAGVGALLLALVTVSFQAIKAALANPVKALRNE